MDAATVDELRDLARRSRRTQRWGFLSLALGLLLLPAHLLAARVVAAEMAALASLAAMGALLLRYAYLAGQERGAFRRVFKRLADDRRRARTLVPDAPPVVATPTLER